ncbi:unnamed protein product [Periconia digitata]|uniref:Uncharacterized protein n=1 Tax=Periconia digitata TaxID=1303443 RepID=A0A9W4U8D6_9PLEO|nr:unnamed protein product [Periconia digitata]
MQLSKILVAASALLSTAFAAPPTTRDNLPTFNIWNNCSYPIWVTTVDRIRYSTESINPHGMWYQNLYYDGMTGTSLQIARTPTGVDSLSEPILNAAYTYNKAEKTLYYDLSTVGDRGYPFPGEMLLYYAAKDPESYVTWNGSIGEQTTKAYLGGETDLMLHLCIIV